MRALKRGESYSHEYDSELDLSDDLEGTVGHDAATIEHAVK